MFKINLRGLTSAGKAIHRNILKPMARMASPKPAATYEDRPAAPRGLFHGSPIAKLRAAFKSPRPTMPQGPAPTPAAPPPLSVGVQWEASRMPHAGVRLDHVAPRGQRPQQEAPAAPYTRVRLDRAAVPNQPPPAHNPSPPPGLPRIKVPRPPLREQLGLHFDYNVKEQRVERPAAPAPRPNSVPMPAGPETPTGQTPLQVLPTPRSQGPLRAAPAKRDKTGKGERRLRFLITADGTAITYDKSHVQGGFGRFHRARLADGTPRGLKQVRLPENSKDSPRQSMARVTLLDEVEREATQMRELGMKVYGVHRTADGKAFVETDLYAGSMAERMEYVPFESRAAVARHALVSMLSQLVPLHARGSVHRDIKNDNLLFNAEGKVQIADPGLMITAREIADSPYIGAAGTPCYMPPESHTEPPAKPAPGADTWAAGCAYLQQLTHEWPLRQGELSAIPARLKRFEKARQAYLTGKPLPSDTWGTLLGRADRQDPEGTRLVLAKLMDPNPQRRVSAAEACAALRQADLRGKPCAPEAMTQQAARGLARAANSGSSLYD